jgi:periplasmic divalent cation tolerance protein
MERTVATGRALRAGGMNGSVLLVLTNLPDRDSAKRVADALIESHAAACVNILAECSSVYRWQGKIETASEIPLLIKTTRASYPRLEMTIRAHHPYELPEIIAVPVDTGLPAYLQWVAQETQLPEIPRPIEE